MKALRFIGAVTAVVVSVAGVVTAVVFGEMPEWARWLLAGASVGVLLIGQWLLRRPLWVDAMAVAVVALGVAALVWATWYPPADPPIPHATMLLPALKLAPRAGEFHANDEVVLVVVVRKRDNDVTVFEGRRHQVTLLEDLGAAATPAALRVKLKRGAEDGAVVALAADVEAAATIQVVGG